MIGGYVYSVKRSGIMVRNNDSDRKAIKGNRGGEARQREVLYRENIGIMVSAVVLTVARADALTSTRSQLPRSAFRLSIVEDHMQISVWRQPVPVPAGPLNQRGMLPWILNFISPGKMDMSNAKINSSILVALVNTDPFLTFS